MKCLHHFCHTVVPPIIYSTPDLPKTIFIQLKEKARLKQKDHFKKKRTPRQYKYCIPPWALPSLMWNQAETKANRLRRTYKQCSCYNSPQSPRDFSTGFTTERVYVKENLKSALTRRQQRLRGVKVSYFLPLVHFSFAHSCPTPTSPELPPRGPGHELELADLPVNLAPGFCLVRLCTWLKF